MQHVCHATGAQIFGHSLNLATWQQDTLNLSVLTKCLTRRLLLRHGGELGMPQNSSAFRRRHLSWI